MTSAVYTGILSDRFQPEYPAESGNQNTGTIPGLLSTLGPRDLHGWRWSGCRCCDPLTSARPLIGHHHILHTKHHQIYITWPCPLSTNPTPLLFPPRMPCSAPECVCAQKASCSCGKEAALHCTCERAPIENVVPTLVESCSCGKRMKGQCTCGVSEESCGAREGETDFTHA